MNKSPRFIETKEYKRFAEFCDACIRYKYIGICYGATGVGKTLSSRYYANWDTVGYQIDYSKSKHVGDNATDDVLHAKTIFYTAPAERATRIRSNIDTLGARIGMTQAMYISKRFDKEMKLQLNSFQGINLIIVDEIDRLKLQHLEQLRDIYDQNDLAMVFIGMPGVEKRLSRYPQLYSRIGFAHEFDKLSKDETHHILEYKWSDLGIDLKLEDFSDYEAITSIIKITKGNFRLIHRLFAQIDRILKINQLDTVTVEVVEAARDSLVIGI
ncbi:AAA family ATPase [Listeria rocourtiae]|uniref:AAA family ATPase n=1 Tax=Listeria rocourtiae TaxID=647910 RepID=UPI001623AF78|nr:AAA family ATPase [Listeria rocourtiae]MBC1433812.1 AAA family ATPase [Listeria rocourtiae]